jgi:nucleolin
MATEDERKLFVAGLPDSVTEDVLRQIFEATGGTVVDVSMPRDRATGRPRGFGFVTLGTAEQAAQARRALDGSLQAGRSISVRAFQNEPPRRGEGREGGARGYDRGEGREAYPRPADRGEGGPRGFERGDAAPRSTAGDRGPGGGFGADRGGDRTLYVGNLPYDCAMLQVEELFEQRGADRPARVHLPVGPDGRPRGFGFVTMSTAEAANAAIVALRDADMNGRRLIINLAHPRGEKPERTEREFRPGPPPSAPPGARISHAPPAAPPPPFLESGKVEGRRRGDRPERTDRKKKRPGGVEGEVARPKRGREKKRGWDDWEEE